MQTALAPVLFLPHGGGPLPLLGDPGHAGLTRFISNLGTQLQQELSKPTAIVVISAHWEETIPALTANNSTHLLYDYSGFPAESYQLTYPAQGAAQLAANIAEKLTEAGFTPQLDKNRGLDHGVFVPLLMLRPEADIPVLQISLLKGLDPAQHIALGEALAFLRRQNVWIVGSGMSFHNMQAFFRPDLVSKTQIDAFNQYLITSLSPERDYAEQADKLRHWLDAPYARLMHPREEHLLPLHVCFGAAKGSSAELLFHDDVLNKAVLAFGWF